MEVEQTIFIRRKDEFIIDYLKTHLLKFGQISFKWRGTLGGTQYCNTVQKNGKYRNTASKID